MTICTSLVDAYYMLRTFSFVEGSALVLRMFFVGLLFLGVEIKAQYKIGF